MRKSLMIRSLIRRLLPLVAVWTLSAAAPARAQSLDAFKEQLARPAASAASLFGRAQVSVTEHGDAARMVDLAARSEQKLQIDGHRVCIFSDSGPDARDAAFAAKALFERTYPGIRAYAVYNPPPYFRVTVGNCLTREEAIILMNRVLPTFPKAYLMSERLSLYDFLD